MKYYKYSRKHFEYELRGILINNKFGFLTDITEEWRKQGNETWERIYKISTKNKSLNIIVFSSIDINTNQVREIGGDAVRLVAAWTTKNGIVYKKISKHYRIESLFKNIERNLISMQEQLFKLNYKEFSKAI